MKNIFNKISSFFLYVIGILFAVILGISLFFRLPYDYIKYKTSPYYKKERKKYEIFAGSSMNFKIYNAVIKNNLPVDFIVNSKENSLDNMSFVLDDILIIPSSFVFTYDDKTGIWDCCKVENCDTSQLSLEDFIEMEIEITNDNAGKKTCTKAVVLTKVKNVDNINVAKNDARFLIYRDNPEEVLKDFCERSTL